VIFGFSIVLLWDQWQLHNGNKATFFPSPPKPGGRRRCFRPGQCRAAITDCP